MRRLDYDMDDRRIVAVSDDGADLTDAQSDCLRDIRDDDIPPGRHHVAARLAKQGFAERIDAGYYRLTEAGESVIGRGRWVPTLKGGR